MNITVVMRQVPDLIEPLDIASSGVHLDWDELSYLANESDEHALEQALLITQPCGGRVTVVALDYGEVDNTLYASLAKGADQVIKIPLDEDQPPPEQAVAAMYAEALSGLECELVLIGCQAHNELMGALGPRLAETLRWPYLGVVRGVEVAQGTPQVRAYKEYPGAVKAAMIVQPPAVLGILAADQPPRYVPVNCIRAAKKSATLEQQDISAPEIESGISVSKLYYPEKGEGAEILDGSDEEIAGRLVQLLETKGMVK